MGKPESDQSSSTVQYGKSNADYIAGKGYYLDKTTNSYWMKKAIVASAKYAEQPRRDNCVVCSTRLEKPAFRYLGAEYALCGNCGHLNGLHEDSLEFAKFLYEQDYGGAAVVYSDETTDSFMQRVRTVYLPKADFLLDALRSVEPDPTRLRYVDLGAGAGHFVMALRERGITQSVGYEASAALVDGSNHRFGGEVLRLSRIGDLAELAESAQADVITMIFSLEHVHDLNGFMAALRRNKTVRYFYFAVPMYTPSALIDVAFPNCAPRVLGLGHTHLFTDRSIDILCTRLRLKRLAEWWFGGNAFDIMRNIALAFDQHPGAEGAAAEWMQQMSLVVDDVQLAFDHKKLSSEVHILAALQD
jgi:hypothetical protein